MSGEHRLMTRLNEPLVIDSYLSADELTRADRCRTPHPQYQFVITRGILRMLLSRYMEVRPSAPIRDSASRKASVDNGFIFSNPI